MFLLCRLLINLLNILNNKVINQVTYEQPVTYEPNEQIDIILTKADIEEVNKQSIIWCQKNYPKKWYRLWGFDDCK